MKTAILTLTLVITMLTSACAQNQHNTAGNYPENPNNSLFSKQNMGTVVGAVGGGYAGNQIGKGKGNALATAGGAILGGLAGRSVGGSLDKADSNAALGARVPVNNDSSLQNALENTRTGNTYTWTNNDGARVSITPTRTYNQNGFNCRDYNQASSYGENIYGSACRQNNGVWVGN